MALALDTVDDVGHIHPRNKQVVAQRLAMAGFAVAYDSNATVPTGPFPSLSYQRHKNTVILVYDQVS